MSNRHVSFTRKRGPAGNSYPAKATGTGCYLAGILKVYWQSTPFASAYDREGASPFLLPAAAWQPSARLTAYNALWSIAPVARRRSRSRLRVLRCRVGAACIGPPQDEEGRDSANVFQARKRNGAARFTVPPRKLPQLGK